MWRHLDLFTGILGFSLGLERTGFFKTVACCEINEFCQKVIRKHKPTIPLCADIEQLWKQLREELTLSPQDFPARMNPSQVNARGYSLTNPPKKPKPVPVCGGS